MANIDPEPKGKRRGRPPKVIEAIFDKILEDLIVRQEPGGRLPPEETLSRRYNVSRQTIRSALDRLESKGYVIRKIKRGTFVAGTRSKQWEKFVGCQIGVVFGKAASFWKDNYLIRIADGVSRKLVPYGMNLTLCMRDWRWWAPGTPSDHFKSLDTLGIFIFERPPAFVAEDLKTMNRPLIALDFDYTDENISSVYFDNYSACEALAKRLQLLGHRRVMAVFEDPTKPKLEKDDAWTQRREGFLSGWNATKAPPVIEYHLRNRGLDMSVLAEVSRQLRLPINKRPTAIYVPTGNFLQPLKDLTHAMNLNVPRDLTVVGCMEYGIFPELTGIRFRMSELSDKASDLMLRMVADNQATPSKVIKNVVKGRYVAAGSHAHAP